MSIKKTQKVGLWGSYYTKKEIERLNVTPGRGRLTPSIVEILREVVILNENGLYNKETMMKKFKFSPWVMNYKPDETLFIKGEIMPKDYVLLQTILKEFTGHYIPMDKFLDFLIKWFLYAYDLRDNIKELEKKKFPFYIKDKNLKKRRLRLFNFRFKKYYKNITKDD